MRGPGGEYGKRLCDWIGLEVETLQPMANGYMTVPSGTRAVVTYQRNGAHLVFKPCSCCGVGWRSGMSKVELSALMPIRRVLPSPGRGAQIYATEAIAEAWPEVSR